MSAISNDSEDLSHLKSIIPEIKYKRLLIDIDRTSAPPWQNDFLVTLKKDFTVSSIYQVVSMRKVKSTRYPRRYELQTMKADDLIPETTVFKRDNYIRINVGKKRAIYIQWYKRNKKK